MSQEENEVIVETFLGTPNPTDLPGGYPLLQGHRKF